MVHLDQFRHGHWRDLSQAFKNSECSVLQRQHMVPSPRLSESLTSLVSKNAMRAHGALITAAFIYSGFNLLMAAAFKDAHVSPIGLSVVREVACIPLLYSWAAVAEAPLQRPSFPDARRFALLGEMLVRCLAIASQLNPCRVRAIMQYYQSCICLPLL